MLLDYYDIKIRDNNLYNQLLFFSRYIDFVIEMRFFLLRGERDYRDRGDNFLFRESS